MHRLSTLVRTRLLPALLVAVGVGVVTAGLVSLPDASIGAAPSFTPRAAIVTAAPSVGSPSPSADSPAPSAGSPSPSTAPLRSASPSPVSPGPTASPLATAVPSVTFPTGRLATRVAIPALDLDLPVIEQPGGPSAYPLCDVAMFIQQLGQPGEGRATYLYAHAREGMFLPLLTQSEIRDGAGMIGMVVQVWTSDEELFLYEISEVRRHATDLDDAVTADDEQLWLQTSEGPRGTVPKLQVVAEFLSGGPAAQPADAHPVAQPQECG